MSDMHCLQPEILTEAPKADAENRPMPVGLFLEQRLCVPAVQRLD